MSPSPTSRVFRSKSMHQPVSPSSSTGPPVPPRRRKRPEESELSGRRDGDTAYDQAAVIEPADGANGRKKKKSGSTSEPAAETPQPADGPRPGAERPGPRHGAGLARPGRGGLLLRAHPGNAEAARARSAAMARAGSAAP